MAIDSTTRKLKSIGASLAVAAVVGLCAGLLTASQARAQAQHPARDTSQGVVFHFGVVPAEMVQGSMHGGAAKGQKHLVLALFDAATGQRIYQAEVQATVAQAGGPMQTKALRLMSIADQPSFGEFFHMSPGGSYRIRFQVKRSGNASAVAEFDYRVPG